MFSRIHCEYDNYEIVQHKWKKLHIINNMQRDQYDSVWEKVAKTVRRIWSYIE